MGRRTPLYEAHVALGARCIEFAGWDMPVSYAGPIEEHRAVRQACGLFDVSHMGEIEIRGAQAEAVCQEVTVNDVGRLAQGRGQYSIMCNEGGGVVDDVIVFRLEPERLLVVVNAANTQRDLEWIRTHAHGRAEIIDRSDETVLLALQGPRAEAIVSDVVGPACGGMSPFAIQNGVLAGYEVSISRTGYTGEDGFEMFVPSDAALPVWEILLAAVRECGGQPAGLAARDTLRLEAALPLCGSDLDESTTPLEAGLGWVVKLQKGAFVGQPALAAQHASGVDRRLVGIEMIAPGIPRHGYGVWRSDRSVGMVTSGAKSPTLGTFIGLAYVGAEFSTTGTDVAVDIRGHRVPARIVGLPFYRRTRREGL